MGVWNGTVRIDIAVINGELGGFELKSDSDNLLRLPAQAELYSRVFDRMTLVVGEKHVAKAAALIPTWWGITTARQGARTLLLSGKRKPKRNPTQDPIQVARLLWRDEALAILERHDLVKGCRSKPVQHLQDRLAQQLPLVKLNLETRIALKQRRAWLGELSSHQGQVTVDTVLGPGSPASSS